MPHSTPLDSGRGFSPPDPDHTNAYLVGGGIASLAAGCCLLHEARVPAAQIHILESSKVTGGAMDGSGNPDTGYVIRGGRMLNFTYRCLYDLLSTIPSLSDPKVTVMDEINMFDAVAGNKTHANARLVTRQAEYPGVRLGLADVRELELSAKDRVDLLRMTAEGEPTLERKKIQDFFDEGFFQTNFWFMWATM
jgi:oleate hydratase